MELNKIYNESNLITMSNMSDNFIDCTITSPPYDNLREYNGYSFDFENVVKELYRITKNGGVVIWIMTDATVNGSKTGTSFKQALFFKDVGFNIHDVMIWSKDTFSFPDNTRYRNTFEYMFVFSKGKPKTINLISDKKNRWANTKVHGTSRNTDGSLIVKSNHNKTNVAEFGVRFNIWDNPTEKNSDIFKHPAMFPERLIHDHIISWTNENDLIYDCFMGSGTTGKVALYSKRNFIGSEISEEYCMIANKRINDFKSQLTLF
jgi:site-specific DNA-methyltransferase (adenine-specific)